MPSCPAGHDSATTDYCDVCGAPMTSEHPVVVATPARFCANCAAAREGRFCEVCGHDSAKPVDATSMMPEAGSGEWSALVQADRSWFDEVRRRGGPEAAVLTFPPHCPQRRFVLSGAWLAIGRGSRSRGIAPDIDLSGPPLDPGVSAMHALLLARPGGGWELIDLDSTNGTTLGDAPEPITPNTTVALAHGDRIKLGAWTTITITYSPHAGPVLLTHGNGQEREAP
ncbi:MAG TPA: FHA domain-containing protein [Pseudonocardiaceae bacterium]|nr:FHA domain-containing protein [Pseudonocardiaceae bacterium]